MKCNDILLQLEETFPSEKAYSWDNVGLLVGRDDKEVNKIYVALDLTDAILFEAIKWGADMIITHHPLIFSSLKKVNNQNYITNRVVELLRNDIAYYAMHTNYDVVRMADLASQKLGLINANPLEPSLENPEEGLGKIGETSYEMTLEEYANYVKTTFGLSTVKVFGGDYSDVKSMNKKIKRVAILPGSGKSAIQAAITKKADVLITGDIGHHEGIDAYDQGLIILDAGHYGIEHIFVEDIGVYLHKLYNQAGIEIKVANIQHPFQVM